MKNRFQLLCRGLVAALILHAHQLAASEPDKALPLRGELLMQLSAELEDPQQVGDTPLGGRRIVYYKGGEFTGAGLRGKLLPGGGDWLLWRNDGVGQLDIRATLRTDDGALIFVSVGGLIDLPPEVRQRILQGESVDPSEYYFRATFSFETGSENYAWLNRLVAVGVGKRSRIGVVYTVYAIR